MNERELISHLQQSLKKPDYLLSWLNEDCEVVDLGGSDLLLVTIDTSSEGYDFPSEAPAFEIGYYSAALSLSDIAACGGRPVGLLVSCSINAEFKNKVTKVYEGLNQAATDANTFILGGDTNSAQEFNLSVVSLGLVERDRVLRRSGGKIGDLVAVSGFMDRYNFGYYQYIKGKQVDFQKMLRQPAPIRVGRILTALQGITSCIDTPDGLIKALQDNAPLNGGFLIYDKHIPIGGFHQDPDIQFNQPNYIFATNPAGDVELLFTVDPNHKDRVEEAFKQSNYPLYWIGEIVQDSGIKVSLDGKLVEPEIQGFIHNFANQSSTRLFPS